MVILQAGIMKRRAFIRGACVFTGLIWVPRALAQVGVGLRSPAFVANLGRSGSACGPNTWYDVATSGETDTPASGTDGALEWTTVTVTQCGSADKARIYLGDNVGTPSINLKMGFHAAGGGAALASGSVANAGSGGDNAYVEVTFGTPADVTSSTNYIIAWIAETGSTDLTYRYLNGAGNWKAKLSFGYGSYPGSIPAEDFSQSRKYAVSLHVT